MQLDENILKVFCENVRYKHIDATTQQTLVKEFLKYNNLNNEFASKSSSYDLANSLRSFDYWFSKRNDEPVHFPIDDGSVYYVDLGAFNLKYETGFIHSCVILKQYSTMLLVVPGSSKKYNKHNFLIEDVVAGDGFKENTGVLIDQAKFITITRVRGTKIGQLNPSTLERIQNKFFKVTLPNSYTNFTNLQNENTNLKNDLALKETELLELKSKIQELTKKLD